MKHLGVAVLAIFIILLGIRGSSIAQTAVCTDDSLRKNDSGKFLMTYSGKLFETLAGDNLNAMLWLPLSSLTICGPRVVLYKGKQYQHFKIINNDDGEMVDALSVIEHEMPATSSRECYKSSIQKPTPFMGNNGEIFVLTDGTVWEIKYEYEYMYEYYPAVVACPTRGYVIVSGKKLNAQIIKKR